MYEHNTLAQFISPHDYPTRGHDDLRPQSARLTLTQNSISVDGPNIWNSIPEIIRSLPSHNSFKFRYKEFLLFSYTSNQTD